jgi:hypothetical protein
MQPYSNLRRIFFEDNLNIFENGRRPQFMLNGRQPQFLNNGRPLHLFFVIEDGHNF